MHYVSISVESRRHSGNVQSFSLHCSLGNTSLSSGLKLFQMLNEIKTKGEKILEQHTYVQQHIVCKLWTEHHKKYHTSQTDWSFIRLEKYSLWIPKNIYQNSWIFTNHSPATRHILPLKHYSNICTTCWSYVQRFTASHQAKCYKGHVLPG